MAKSSRYANYGGVPAANYVVFRSSAAACNPFFPEIPKSSLPQIQEFAQKLQRIHFKRHLNFEVVDDTALLLPSKGKIGKNQPPKIKNYEKKKKMKKKETKLMPQRHARKDWKIKKTADDDKGKVAAAAAAAYSRAEMVALSREDLEGQRKKWSEVYGGLAASVAAEYDGLVAAAARRGASVPSFATHRRPSFMEKPHNIDAAATEMGKGSPLRISVH